MSWRRRGGWDDWDSWGYRKAPRLPADGIKAQTQRGKFGATWWAGRWLAALEALVDSARLSRGRSYARSGQVVKLDVGSQGIQAKVQGSRPRPYDVSIGFRRLSDKEWDKVADAMAAEALYAAKLLTGEMPEHIEEAFKSAGATLFPAKAGDLETDCSCPDWANPCKHVAAVYYLLGERFDAEPFLMFELRGRSKDEIAELLRARRAGSATDEAAEVAPESVETADEAEDVVPLFLVPAGDSSAPATAPATAAAAAVEAFWTAPAALSEVSVDFETRPPVDALPVKALGKPPFWPGDQDFTAAMEQAYKAIGERARRLALEEK